ncbi:hypothetical protein SUGI_0765680 [Cryptomeria japonica]|nr:hypothetical protein SUGI_0765680 [Cryptomeria japonica]
MASSAATFELIEHSTIDNLAKTEEYAPTPFSIQSINAGDDLPSTLIQVLSFQKMQNNTDDTDRHKLVLSDGTYMQLEILPSKYTILIDSDILKIGTIIQLSSYTCGYIWNTRTIVILSLEVKQSDCLFFEQKKHTYRTNTIRFNNTTNVYEIEEPFYMSQLYNKRTPLPFHGLAFNKEQHQVCKAPIHFYTYNVFYWYLLTMSLFTIGFLLCLGFLHSRIQLSIKNNTQYTNVNTIKVTFQFYHFTSIRCLII